MIDTLKLSKGLQRAGMTEAQAEGVTEALNDAQTDYVTKKDLDLGLERLKGELQRFILVMWSWLRSHDLGAQDLALVSGRASTRRSA